MLSGRRLRFWVSVTSSPGDCRTITPNFSTVPAGRQYWPLHDDARARGGGRDCISPTQPGNAASTRTPTGCWTKRWTGIRVGNGYWLDRSGELPSDLSGVPRRRESPDYGVEQVDLLNHHRILRDELISSEFAKPEEPFLVFTRSWSASAMRAIETRVSITPASKPESEGAHERNLHRALHRRRLRPFTGK